MSKCRPSSLLASIACIPLLVAIATPSPAADHGDAPLLARDPDIDVTDVYAFLGLKYDGSAQTMLNVIVQTAPYGEPGAGPSYGAIFPDDAAFLVHITDPNTGVVALSYRFAFSPVDPLGPPGLKNASTILSFGVDDAGAPGALAGADDPFRNYTQRYSVTRISAGVETVIGSGLVTAPPNPGPNVTPLYNGASGTAASGAQTFSELDAYTQDAVHELASGEVVFAGPRDDAFYADLAGILDLIDERIFSPSPGFPDTLGQQGGGPDSLRGFNVNTIAIQIPLSTVSPFGASYAAEYFGALTSATGVGVYASAERQRLRIERSDAGALKTGPWIQIERAANPLLGLLFLELADKNAFNRSSPSGDVAFQSSLLTPRFAALVNDRSSASIPVFPETSRSDLVDLFVPDVLRVDITTGPVPLPGQVGFNRLSILAGDTTGGQASGWPNGRRPGDDVVDLVLSVLASGPTYLDVLRAGDNVNANDQIYHQVFPYVPTPHSGANHQH